MPARTPANPALTTHRNELLQAIKDVLYDAYPPEKLDELITYPLYTVDAAARTITLCNAIKVQVRSTGLLEVTALTPLGKDVLGRHKHAPLDQLVTNYLDAVDGKIIPTLEFAFDKQGAPSSNWLIDALRPTQAPAVAQCADQPPAGVERIVAAAQVYYAAQANVGPLPEYISKDWSGRQLSFALSRQAKLMTWLRLRLQNHLTGRRKLTRGMIQALRVNFTMELVGLIDADFNDRGRPFQADRGRRIRRRRWRAGEAREV